MSIVRATSCILLVNSLLAAQVSVVMQYDTMRLPCAAIKVLQSLSSDDKLHISCNAGHTVVCAHCVKAYSITLEGHEQFTGWSEDHVVVNLEQLRF